MFTVRFKVLVVSVVVCLACGKFNCVRVVVFKKSSLGRFRRWCASNMRSLFGDGWRICYVARVVGSLLCFFRQSALGSPPLTVASDPGQTPFVGPDAT